MSDPLLDRLQRSAIACALVIAAMALLVTRGDWWAAASVVGGALLVMISFVSIRGGIEALAAFAAGPRDHAQRPKVGRPLAKMAGRYALLAFLAYVMIARLRLHPLGLVAGASSVVAAAALEATRFVRK
ncbi:MAG: hypothetical protein HOQ29_08945 [Acidobacteria bacterium]|nr:hypothetical protein [Acidobacteriota bacterium]